MCRQDDNRIINANSLGNFIGPLPERYFVSGMLNAVVLSATLVGDAFGFTWQRMRLKLNSNGTLDFLRSSLAKPQWSHENPFERNPYFFQLSRLLYLINSRKWFIASGMRKDGEKWKLNNSIYSNFVRRQTTTIFSTFNPFSRAFYRRAAISTYTRW